MRLSKHRPAQSLLEAIIAIGVILVATISAVTLIVVTINAGRVSSDKIQAVNFAREGIEVVREIRDSNWLKRAQNIQDNHTPIQAGDTTVQWDDSGAIDDGYVPLSGSYGAQYNKLSGWSLIPYANNEVIGVNSLATSFFTQNCTNNCTATKYSRLITISKSSAESTTAGDFLDVTSTVTWKNHGNKTLAVKARLYDWR